MKTTTYYGTISGEPGVGTLGKSAEFDNYRDAELWAMGGWRKEDEVDRSVRPYIWKVWELVKYKESWMRVPTTYQQIVADGYV